MKILKILIQKALKIIFNEIRSYRPMKNDVYCIKNNTTF